MNGIVLPEGYSEKFGFHVVRDLQSDAGSMPNRGGRKAVTHITVTDERHVHTARDALVGEGFEPTLLVGFDIAKAMRPFLYQFAGLDRKAKALQHPGGTAETNGGGQVVVQLEIACMVADVPHFGDIGMYRVLANVWRMVNDEFHAHGQDPIPWVLWSPRVARANGGRLSPEEFIRARGHGGHRNVPSQPAGHDDPTAAFEWSTLLRRLHSFPDRGAYDLSGTGFHQIRKG